MQISISVPNAQAITGAFLKAPEMVLDEMETTMGSVLLYLDRETKENIPLESNASGMLRQSWYTQVHVVAQLDSVFGRLTNPLPYALPVELGTKPHFPPLAPLINWAEQKAHLYGDEAEALARGIQRKIGAHGSKGLFMATRALADAPSSIEADFTECAQRITTRLAQMGKGTA